MIQIRKMKNKNVALDTKIKIWFIILLFLLLLLSLFSSIHKYTSYVFAEEVIPESTIYYVSQHIDDINPDLQKYGLSFNGDHSADIFYPTLEILLESILKQHNEATVEFVPASGSEIITLKSSVCLSNENNRITSKNILLKLRGTIKSELHGGGYYAEPNINNYAFQFNNMGKVVLEELSLSAQTVAIKITPDTVLDIEKSNISVKAEHSNAYSSGAIFNDRGVLNILQSNISWDTTSKVEQYAIFSYGNVNIDETVSSEPYSKIEGPGGIIMRAGELKMHGGSLASHAASKYALQVEETKAEVISGTIKTTAPTATSSVIVKQGDVNLLNGVTIDKGVFVGASDVALNTSITLGGVTLNVPPGGFNISITASEFLNIGNNDSETIINIIDIKEDRVSVSGWGETGKNSISLSEAIESANNGNLEPKADFIYYVTYQYLNADGAVHSEDKIPIKENEKHVFKAHHNLYKSDYFHHKAWRDRLTNNAYSEGDSVTIKKDYVVYSEIELIAPNVVIKHEVVNEKNREIKLNCIVDEYSNLDPIYNYKWFLIEANSDKKDINDANEKSIHYVPKNLESSYECHVSVTVKDRSVISSQTIYQSQNYGTTRVTLENVDAPDDTDNQPDNNNGENSGNENENKDNVKPIPKEPTVAIDAPKLTRQNTTIIAIAGVSVTIGLIMMFVLIISLLTKLQVVKISKLVIRKK